ncbi:MAG: hypothetical protein ACI8UO_004996 [Verrucomicrobiales bacterium]|jgi:hypothetical protein
MTFDALILCSATNCAEGVSDVIDPRSTISAREVPRQARDDNWEWHWQIEIQLEFERHPTESDRTKF